MRMVDTSKDILYIVLAFCSVWLTVFLCWALYYFAMTMKHANEIITEIRDKVHAIVEAMEYIRERMDFVSAGMHFMSKYLNQYLGLGATDDGLEDDEDTQPDQTVKRRKKK